MPIAILMDISSIALQGVEQASAQVDAAASQIASAGSFSGSPAPVDTVSLSEEMVAMMSAKTALSANVDVFKTAEQIQQNVLNVMA
ncbi:MAG: flagellar basal body rod C-terminal domain-containing protein [Terriglobales bacterium]